MNYSLKYIGMLLLGACLLLTGCPDKAANTDNKTPDAGKTETKTSEKPAAGAAKELPKPKADAAEVEAALALLGKYGGSSEKNAAGAVTSIALKLSDSLEPPTEEEKAGNPNLTVSETSEFNKGVATLFDAINKLVDLEKFSFEGPGIDDFGVTRLTSLKNVTVAYFENTNIGNATLEMMSENMSNLVDLSLNRCLLLDGDSLAIIADSENLSKIKILNLQSNGFSTFDMLALPDLEQLEQLDIRQCTSIDGNVLKYIAEIPNLKVLKLRGTAYNDSAIAFLADHPKLQSLHLQDATVTDACLDSLATIPSLTDLSLFRLSEISNEGLQKLEGSGLQRLLIRDNDKINNDGMKVIGTMPNLSRLTLYEVRSVNDEGLADAIKGNKKLINLALYDMPDITDKTRATLATTTALRGLEMRMTGQTDVTLQLASKLPRLETIIIGYNANFTDKGFDYLGENKAIKRIEIKDTSGITKEAIEKFESSHPNVTIKETTTGGGE